MDLLNEQQIELAIEAMKEYSSASNSSEKTVRIDDDFDQKREMVIESELKPLLSNYLSGNLDLSEFKSKVDSINKRNELWGFKGIKGQMFFNIVFNVADNIDECNAEIKSAITLPENEQIASSRINNFTSYVRDLGNNGLKQVMISVVPQKLAVSHSFYPIFGRSRIMRYGPFTILTV